MNFLFFSLGNISSRRLELEQRDYSFIAFPLLSHPRINHRLPIGKNGLGSDVGPRRHLSPSVDIMAICHAREKDREREREQVEYKKLNI
jgi:hypothetical protein